MVRIKSNFVGSNLGLESIDFIGNSFFKELTLAFTDLKAEPKKTMADSEVVQRIMGIIKHNTGMNLSFTLDIHGPCVEVPQIDKNNPLINSLIRDLIDSNAGLKMIAAAENGVARGTVNLRTGKVTGIFANAPATIHFPLYEMLQNDRYLPEELAAMLLHEIGHLFTYYEYLSRSVTTNQVLAGMSKALDGSSGVDEREAVLISVKRALSLTDLDVKTLAKSSNTKTAEIVVISNITRVTASELGSNIYDFSTWEYLCDEFATRHGAGRYLVTALDKLFRQHGHRSFRNTPGFLAYEAFKLILVFSIVGSAAGLLLVLFDGSGDGTYDEPGARMKRVRNQIVENLKDKQLTSDDHARLLADLVCIDDLLRNVNDRRQFFGVVWDALTSSKARDQKLLQQELEALAVSELFVKAAVLKQMV